MGKALKTIYYFVRKSSELELDYASTSFLDLANTLNIGRKRLTTLINEYDDSNVPYLVERILGHIYYETNDHFIVKSTIDPNE